MSQTYFYSFERDDETEVTVEYGIASFGCAAKTYGLPENCYPAEPMEIETIKAWIENSDGTSTDTVLTEAEDQKVCEDISQLPGDTWDSDPEWDR